MGVIVSDEEIIELFSSEKTKEKAFRIIVNQFSRQLYSRIRAVVNSHEEADDILQNTFLKAWRSLANFRKESNLYTWLYKIATNEAFSFIRANSKKLSVSLDDDSLKLVFFTSGIDDAQSGEQIRQRLHNAVDQLPEKQKKVFEMKYFGEMKYDDMALELNTSVGALKASYHHAVKKIEKLLEF
ncbi:MAG: RNA polymerase sigma factor [Bacteroidales bacterium]|nr:RNA polymerase sigma factor [Bacteroidales bacterium]